MSREDGEEMIRGKRGNITQYADGGLNVWVTNSRVANALIRSGVKPLHRYDDGADFCIAFDQLPRFAEVIKAKKRPIMTPERLEHLARISSGARFTAKASSPQAQS